MSTTRRLAVVGVALTALVGVAIVLLRWDQLVRSPAEPSRSSVQPPEPSPSPATTPPGPASARLGSRAFGSPPVGYRRWYHVDFRQLSELPPGWTARTGRTNNAATFRAENVRVDPGRGLVHTAERAGVGAPVYSGAANGRINVPQRLCIRYTARAEGFKRGIWPSFWMRPQSGGEGELDLLEGFGGHIASTQGRRVWGAGLIATPYGPHQVARTVDFRLPEPEWNRPHEYLQCKTADGLFSWVDGVRQPSLVRAGVDPGPGGQSMPADLWDAQFEDDKTWYLRTDLQVGDDPDGHPVGQAGPLSDDQVGEFATWTIERIAIFVPAA